MKIPSVARLVAICRESRAQRGSDGRDGPPGGVIEGVPFRVVKMCGHSNGGDDGHPGNDAEE